MREWIRRWLIGFLRIEEDVKEVNYHSIQAGIAAGLEAARPKWPYGDVATAEQVAALNALSDDDRADIARKEIEAYTVEFAAAYLPDYVERFVEETLEHRPLQFEIDPIKGMRLKLVKFERDDV